MDGFIVHFSTMLVNAKAFHQFSIRSQIIEYLFIDFDLIRSYNNLSNREEKPMCRKQ